MYFSQHFPIFFEKWANNTPILRKKWDNFGKNTKFSHDFSQCWKNHWNFLEKNLYFSQTFMFKMGNILPFGTQQF